MGALGIGFNWLVGSDSRPFIYSYPIYWCLAVYSLLVQFIVFIPSALLQTEIFFDSTTGFTILSMTAIATFTNNNMNTRQYISTLLIGAWAFRLVVFLVTRMVLRKRDSRFDELKKSPLPFFMLWYFQGVCLMLSLSPLLVIITNESSAMINDSINSWEVIGIAIWAMGMIVEAVADHQKLKFSQNIKNKGKFIDCGLWSLSRHPNYVGEIVIWVGATIFAFPSLSGWQTLSLISPVLSYFVLMYASGVNYLE